MQLDLPEIRTGNEVESLARASQNMLNDMREYVKDLLKKEKELAKLSTMANWDPLTRVGNRNAYESFAEALQLKMSEGLQEYAILVMNTNGLKKINDEHGHEKGDLYLLKACRLVCEIFQHTPVFRLGGDEFAAVMSGEDYRNRTELVKQIRKELAQAHEQFKGEAFTDDCSLLERIGHKVKIVPGAYENIKITTPEDLE